MISSLHVRTGTVLRYQSPPDAQLLMLTGMRSGHVYSSNLATSRVCTILVSLIFIVRSSQFKTT